MPQAAEDPPGYTDGMENVALFLFVCGIGSFGIATYLMRAKA
jgi:hypothetical protein